MHRVRSPNATRYVEMEHVIVDGSGTDGTVELALGYGLRVLQGKDSGIFAATDKGSFNSSGWAFSAPTMWRSKAPPTR